MKRAIGGVGRRLTYANVMVTLLALVVLGGGGAYALSAANGARRADLAVAISGPPSVLAAAGSPPVAWSEHVGVVNHGPGSTRPVVLVGAPGKLTVAYDNAGDDDQRATLGTVLDLAHTSASCLPLGAETDIVGIASRSGPLVCEGPILASGGSTKFTIAFLSYSCDGDYVMRTMALATSAVLDPNESNDRATRTVSITTTSGCG